MEVVSWLRLTNKLVCLLEPQETSSAKSRVHFTALLQVCYPTLSSSYAIRTVHLSACPSVCPCLSSICNVNSKMENHTNFKLAGEVIRVTRSRVTAILRVSHWPHFLVCISLNPLDSKGIIIVPHRIIRSWYTGRWWVGCYIWYSEEGPGLAAAPPSPLLAVPNEAAHPSTASVPIIMMVRCCAVLMWRLNG